MRSWEKVVDMLVVEVSHIAKSFADKVAVDGLSFSVAQGEMFGLIGPNGAGKTTTIRMIMDILKPDSGEVTILGEKLNEATKNRLGYLPEERGLYKKLKVLDYIVYLASLKGVDRHSAAEKTNELLNQTGISASKNKKIEELSRGMGQIIQFIVTIIHDPQLLVLDEPFAGLDPVNTELLKGMLADLRNQGKAVILSTHQMNQLAGNGCVSRSSRPAISLTAFVPGSMGFSAGIPVCNAQVYYVHRILSLKA